MQLEHITKVMTQFEHDIPLVPGMRSGERKGIESNSIATQWLTPSVMFSFNIRGAPFESWLANGAVMLRTWSGI